MKGVAMESRAPTRPDLPADLMAVLRCPHCGGTLEEQPRGLSCVNDARNFPRVNGVVRFVELQEYAGSFGFQWHRYGRTQLDNVDSHESEETFRRKTGFTPAELSGKLVLDVGCGMGRFAEVASRWGARVIGVDLSQAAEVAADNLVARENVTFVQANLFSLPFAPETFDYIYSIGVLHHTPNCEQAFRSLLPFLKPGGHIAIWLYSGYNKWYRLSDFYRKLTSRLPNRWLLALCHVAVPLYSLHRLLRRVPVLGQPLSGLLGYLLPVSLNPKRDWRVLDTFDWYSPKYQSKHTYEEVSRWFEIEGLDSVRVLYEPIALQGRKPSCGPGVR
jgi:ubiquinone/menaquinone biosynthesis C-methylase UbiE